MTKREQEKLAKMLLLLYEILNDAIDKLHADDPEQLPLLVDLQEARQHVLRLWQDFDLTIDAAGPDFNE